jgi:hypothetical protein
MTVKQYERPATSTFLEMFGAGLEKPGDWNVEEARD